MKLLLNNEHDEFQIRVSFLFLCYTMVAFHVHLTI